MKREVAFPASLLAGALLVASCAGGTDVEPASIKDITVIETIKEGRTVYKADPAASVR